MQRIQKIIIFACMFISIFVHAYQEQEVLDALLKTSSQHVFNLGYDTILLSLAHENNALSYRVTYPFSFIANSGFYRLASQVTGAIAINASNVTLDLNGNTVTGGITIASGLSNIALQNGIIDVSDSSIDGIVVNSGCNLITINNVLVRAGRCGIALRESRLCTITECEMTLNVTGIQLDTCSNITIKNCTASRNRVTGYGLILSTTCLLNECRAFATGFNNTQVNNATISGFLSTNGFGNMFDGCVANGTQALTTTDFNSVVAGFALTGTEQCSTIINSFAQNTITNATGVTIPYGILLQETLGQLTTLTSVSTGSISDIVRTLSWTSDGAYLAVGGTLSGPDIQVYQYNPLTQSLILTATMDLGSLAIGRSVQWSPDNRYLAIGGSLDGNDLRVVQFITESQTLAQVASVDAGKTTGVVNSVAWSPNGNYLAVGKQEPDNVQLYFFDRINLSLTQVTTISVSGDTAFVLAWSPDGRFLAVGGGSSSNEITVYYFNSATGQLTQVAAVDFGAIVFSVTWSPDGSYLAAGGLTTGNDLYIYRFSLIGSSYTLIPITSALTGTVFALSWSPDGRMLAVGGAFTGNDVAVYFFDRGSGTLQFLQSVSSGGTGADLILAVQWSPDGTVLAVGGEITGSNTFDLQLLRALQFPSSNIIMNNTVSNNSGSLFPSGIGLSGSSIVNYIVGNTSFNNPQNPWMVYTNYANVCNVFNQLFFQAPTLLQNVQGSMTTPIAIPDDVNARMGRVLSMADDIQTKVNFLVAGSPL